MARNRSSHRLTNVAWILLPCFALCATAPTLGVTFTEDTYIGPGDTTYDNEHIIVDGCTLTVDGAHPFNSLQVINSGVVTHSANSDTQEYWLDLTIATDVSIEAGSRIDVDGRGYTAQNGPGAGAEYSGYGSGAGYGGNGGSMYLGYGGGPGYGSILAPTDLGSGGGHASYGSSGGGGIRLSVGGTVTIEGSVTANGADAAGNGGGGSGGSIYLTAGTITGGGTISAVGGQSGHAQYAGGGGGGRIALYAGFGGFQWHTPAHGGDGSMRGGAGTAYFKAAGDATGTLVIDNNSVAGAWTPLTSPEAFDLAIRHAAVGYPEAAMTIGDLGIHHPGSTLIHAAGGSGIDLTVQGDATIDADGAISVDGMGYPAETGPGAGSQSNGYGSGAGYGGEGGQNAWGITGGGAYGSIIQPTDLGSGGGHSSSGGRGGGAIRLSVNGTLTVDGNLTANGSNAGGNGGGGSGGSIYLTAGTLAGSGVISANGGQSGHAQYAGGGGGGRIAIEYTTDSFAGNMSAHGGTDAAQIGGAGTIYTVASGKVVGELLVDNGGSSGAWTPLTSPVAFNVTISNGAIAYPTAAMTIGDLDMAAGGLFTHPPEDTSFDITVQGDATIDADGAIGVDGMGCPAETGPGAGSETAGYGSGAGYGGNGGNNYVGMAGGLAYGSIVQPTDLGSGGGHPTGGAGGGAVRLDVSGTLTIDGSVTANGADGGANAGGGSGGSIYLTVGTLAGSGVISSNGGQSGHAQYAGAGGGGRIAIEYTTSSFTGNISAYGGTTAFQVGGAGTIYTVASVRAAGDLLVDNGAGSGAWTPLTSPVAFNVTISNGAIAHPTAAMTIGDLDMAAGGLFTHPPEDNNFDITVQGDATVELDGAISVDGMGYPAEIGPGAGSQSAGYGSGAGCGGNGGNNYVGMAGGLAYGSIPQPTDLGSGGGHATAGGWGGGAVRLSVNGTLTVDGNLTANGNDAGSDGGGGSGGTIYLTVGTLAGSGVISADGGQSGHSLYAGGGGGGRIAIEYTTNSFAGDMSAYGGTNAFQFGGAGTIYTVTSGKDAGDLLVDNGANSGAWTPLTSPLAFNVMIGNGAIAYPTEALSIGNLEVAADGLLTHLAEDAGFDVTVQGDATIDAAGAIRADGMGYPAEAGPGAGGASSNYGSGAGYGGEGGQNSYGTAGGDAYGSIIQPTDLGSGGGYSNGGAGGGALRLTVNGTLTVEGRLSADGNDGGTQSGGGSGGSIYLTVGTLTGTGVILANGGDSGHSYAGGGGGGRIAIYCCDVLMPGEQITVEGGTGWENGEDGSIFFGSSTVEILTHPADQRAYEGDPVTFTVVATGDGELSYQWRKNDEDLVDDDRISGATTDTLTIDPVVLGDAGDYNVIVTDDCGPFPSDSALLIVPPDLNGDGCVDESDLGILLADWGCTDGDCSGDCDGDGDTDQGDLGILLAHWGEEYP